jgi:PTS system cellobiose-specific IIB component
MDTILIVCGAGASSTFLASRMRAIAATRGLPVRVEAISQYDLSSRLPGASALLVGPHLAPMFDSLVASAAVNHVPAALLDPSAFGPSGAETAIDLASKLIQTGWVISQSQPEGHPHG